MKLKFSIIIPSFNQGVFIAQTINSILNQSYQNFEILVIDGGSNDSTLEILKSYEDRIFWLSEKDKGQTHAINKGIALAKGDVIAYLNSDDYYAEDAFEKVASVFNQNDDVLWITGDYLIVDEDGKKIQSAIAKYKIFFRNHLSFNLLTVLNPIIQPATFLRRELINKTGLFNEGLSYTMDYEYWLRAIKTQKPYVLRHKLAAFRIHANSKGGSSFMHQFDEELKVAKKYQTNHLLILFHTLHNCLINISYYFLKK
jgi:glycosyltransferase involved in cell wall biosynthesis